MVGVIGGSIWLFAFLKVIEGGLFLTLSILWFLSMKRAMQACHPISRSADPDAAWFCFIPVFGFFWQFVTSAKVSDSIAREYHRRGWYSDEDRPGLELGIVAGVTICLVFLVRIIFNIHPGFGFIGTLAMCVTMYRHTDRLNSFRERLEKEFDPTTAFGQIPIATTNVYFPQTSPTIPTGPPPIYVNPEVYPVPKTSDYSDIPFVPQAPFVESNKLQDSVEKNSDVPFEELKINANNQDSVKRWMPKDEGPTL